MFHCITKCYDGKTLWTPGETSVSIPSGMDKFFKAGKPPVPEKQETIVALSQFAKPAFEVNPSEVIPISQYGKPKKK